MQSSIMPCMKRGSEDNNPIDGLFLNENASENFVYGAQLYSKRVLPNYALTRRYVFSPLTILFNTFW